MSVAVVPNPIGLTFNRWSAELCHQDVTVPLPFSEDRWRDWGAQFLLVSGADPALPSPYSFKKWQDWARELKKSLNA